MRMTKPVTVGDLVRYLRRHLDMSLGDLSRKTGYSITTLSALERYEEKHIDDCAPPPIDEHDVDRFIMTERMLHPYGRCTCHGEGTCDWHQGACKKCGGSGTEDEHKRGYVETYKCRACSGSGREDPDTDWEMAEDTRRKQGAEMRYQAEAMGRWKGQKR